MKRIVPYLCFMIVALTLVTSCNSNKGMINEDILNDYLPLKVGAKYHFKYSEYYAYLSEYSKKDGECIWDFVSASIDTPVVYQVKQSFSGLYVHRWGYRGADPLQTDSIHVDNEITVLNFKVLKDRKVVFTYFVPYWGEKSLTFERFIQSVKADTCLDLGSMDLSLCLKKNVGIMKFTAFLCGNHCSSIDYSLIDGSLNIASAK